MVVFALGRPFLSAAYAVAQVHAAEQTDSSQRASAVALVAAGYAVGAGATVVIYGQVGNGLGYRGILLLALVPMIALPFVARWVSEPERFLRAARIRPATVAGPRRYRPSLPARLALVTVLAFSLGVITGPANSFVYLYAQNVERFPGVALSAMVVAAGVLGLGGLWPVVGWPTGWAGGRRRWGPWCASGHPASSATAVTGLPCVVGYLAAVTAGGIIAPAAGAFVNELFPDAGTGVCGRMEHRRCGARGSHRAPPVRRRCRHRQPVRSRRPW